MYTILVADTEEVIATTRFEDVAKAIANSLPIKCVVRYADMGTTVYYKAPGTNFFSANEKQEVA